MLSVRFIGASQALDEIVNRLQDSGSRCRIAVAFLRTDGMRRLEPGLRRVEGKIVAGASGFCITDPEALDMLRNVCVANPKLFVRRFYHENFHPKAFYFENGAKSTAIIGSSNLTGGGLERNVEANILVRGSSNDTFFQQVRSFLDSLYDAAEPLDQKFVDYYRRQVKRRRETEAERGSGPGLHRTPLPPQPSLRPGPPTQISVPRHIRWWKIAPGADGHDWPNWKNHIDSLGRGFVSMGWSKVGNLKEKLDWPWDRFRSKIGLRIGKHYDSDPDYASRQMWVFGNEIGQGDMVVAYSERTVYGLAKVVGAYAYRPDLSGYPHTRRVHWLATPGITPPRGIMQRLATNDTVHRIEDKALTVYLRGLLH